MSLRPRVKYTYLVWGLGGDTFGRDGWQLDNISRCLAKPSQQTQKTKMTFSSVGTNTMQVHGSAAYQKPLQALIDELTASLTPSSSDANIITADMGQTLVPDPEAPTEIITFTVSYPLELHSFLTSVTARLSSPLPPLVCPIISHTDALPKAALPPHMVTLPPALITRLLVRASASQTADLEPTSFLCRRALSSMFMLQTELNSEDTTIHTDATCRVRSAHGQAFARGSNQFRRLGTCSSSSVLQTWTRVNVPGTITRATVTPHAAVYSTMSGAVYQAGINPANIGATIGDAQLHPQPVRLPVKGPITWAASGIESLFIVDSGPVVLAAGVNTLGQLGVGELSVCRALNPTKVPKAGLMGIHCAGVLTFFIYSGHVLVAGAHRDGPDPTIQIRPRTDVPEPAPLMRVNLPGAVWGAATAGADAILVGMDRGFNVVDGNGTRALKVEPNVQQVWMASAPPPLMAPFLGLVVSPTGYSVVGDDRAGVLEDIPAEVTPPTYVQLGGRHAFVVKDSVAYYKGPNKQGCSGLGHKDAVTTWTRLPFAVDRMVTNEMITVFLNEKEQTLSYTGRPLPGGGPLSLEPASVNQLRDFDKLTPSEVQMVGTD